MTTAKWVALSALLALLVSSLPWIFPSSSWKSLSVPIYHQSEVHIPIPSIPAPVWNDDATFLREWDLSQTLHPRLLTPLSSLPTYEEFINDYQYQKPFVVRHYFNFSSDLNSLLEKGAFTKKFGNYRISTGSQLELGAGGAGTGSIKLKDYVADLSVTDGHSPTFFDRGQFLRRSPSLAKQLRIPYQKNVGSGERIFSIGGPGSGLSFHQHKDAFNVILVGSKRWALADPGSLPSAGFDPGRSHQSWLRAQYPNLRESERPVEILQRAGDLVYVPEGWYHATMNLEETVTYALQVPESKGDGFMFHYNEALRLTDTSPQQAFTQISKALALYPNNADALNQRGMILYNLMQAEQSLGAAIQHNPLLGVAYQNMAILQEQVSAEAAQSPVAEAWSRGLHTPGLDELYHRYGMA